MMDIKRLRAWAEEQGHTVPLDSYVQEMLLAQERHFGRTHERGIDRERAKLMLNRLIDRFEGEFPQQRPGEYPGIRELRAYVDVRRQANAKAREAERVAEQEPRPGAPAPEQTVDEEDLVLAQRRGRTQGRSR